MDNITCPNPDCDTHGRVYPLRMVLPADFPIWCGACSTLVERTDEPVTEEPP